MRGQVVEAVEEDRPPPPCGARRREQLDRLARDAVGVDEAEAVADLGVAGEQRGEVAEEAEPSSVARHGFDVGRIEAGALELVEQALERLREAGLAGRVAQRAELRARSATAAATAPQALRGVRTAAGRRPPAAATARKRPPKVITSPPSTAPPAQSSRSKL